MKRIYLALTLLLIAGTSVAYNIKDTANPVALYTGSNTTPTINAATNGTVTLGPTGFTGTHSINGNLSSFTYSSNFTLLANTADGSDSRNIIVGGGGGTNSGRGGNVQIFGNEAGSGLGGQIYLAAGNSTDASAANNAIVFQTSLSGGASVTNGLVTGAGNWLFGPSSATAANGHGFTGYVKVEGNTSSPYPIYIGRSATNYPIIGANAAPTTTTLQVSRQVTDTSTVMAFGNAVAGAGTAMELHGFASGGAGNLTLSSSSLLGSVANGGAWTLGNVAGNTTTSHRIQGSQADYALKVENLAGASSSNFGMQVKVNTTGSLAAFNVANTSGTLFNINGTGDTTIAQSAAKPFVISGTTGNLRSTYVRDNTTATAANLVIDSNGDFFKNSSSIRYKDNVDYDGVDPGITYQLKPVSFDSKRDHSHHIGFIAEDVIEVEPRLVTVDNDGRPEAVEYPMVTAALVASLKQLRQEFDAYKAAHP